MHAPSIRLAIYRGVSGTATISKLGKVVRSSVCLALNCTVMASSEAFFPLSVAVNTALSWAVLFTVTVSLVVVP